MRHLIPPSAAPAAPALRFVAQSFCGGLLAILACSGLSLASGYPWLMAPFGASCVLVFAAPDSPLAQPRHVLGGHLLAALSGLLVLMLLGSSWWSIALAVALAIAVMQLARCVHPPAGATPLVVLAAQPGWDFLLTPVLAGSVVIVSSGWLIGRWRGTGAYPRYWW